MIEAKTGDLLQLQSQIPAMFTVFARRLPSCEVAIRFSGWQEWNAGFKAQIELGPIDCLPRLHSRLGALPKSSRSNGVCRLQSLGPRCSVWLDCDNDDGDNNDAI